MRITKLELQNFRAFESLAGDLHEEFTLLVGKNGAGKTAVLDALAIGLSQWLGGAWQQADRELGVADARQVGDAGDGLPSLTRAYPVSITFRACEWRRAEEASDPEQTWHSLTLTGRHGQYEYERHPRGTSRLDERHAADPSVLLPLVAFYPANRGWRREAPVTFARVDRRERESGYANALEASSSIDNLVAWMEWREQDRIQRLARAHEEGRALDDVKSPELEAVSAAACACLEGAKRLYYSVNFGELRVEFLDGRPPPCLLARFRTARRISPRLQPISRGVPSSSTHTWAPTRPSGQRAS